MLEFAEKVAGGPTVATATVSKVSRGRPLENLRKYGKQGKSLRLAILVACSVEAGTRGRPANNAQSGISLDGSGGLAVVHHVRQTPLSLVIPAKSPV